MQPAIGPSEWFVWTTFFSSLALPLGTPPGPDNPAFAQLTPNRPILCVTWNDRADADSDSSNATERILAEPEVKRFLSTLAANGPESVRLMSTALPFGFNDAGVKSAKGMFAVLGSRGGAMWIEEHRHTERDRTTAGAVVFQVDGDAGKIAKAIALALADGEPTRAEKIQGHTFTQLTESDPPVHIGVVDSYVVCALGNGVVERMLERMKAKATPAWLTESKSRERVPRVGVMGYVDLKTLEAKTSPTEKDRQTAKGMGVDALTKFEWTSGMDGDGLVTVAQLTIDGPARGLVAMFDGPGLKPSDVEHIPNDAAFAFAGSVDWGRVYRELNAAAPTPQGDPGAVQKDSPYTPPAPRGEDEISNTLNEIAREVGCQDFGKLLDQFGDVWTAHLSPVDGWVTGLTVGFVPNDRAGFAAAINSIGKGPPGTGRWTSAIGLGTKSTKAKEFDTHVVTGVPVTLPTFAVGDGRGVLTLFPAAARTALTLPANERGFFAPEFASPLLKREGRLLYLSKIDHGPMLDLAYVQASNFMNLTDQMFAIRRRFNPGDEDAVRMPIRISELPPERVFRRHLRPAVSAAWRTAEGVEFVSRQTIPMPDPGTITAFVATAGYAAAFEERSKPQKSPSEKQLTELGEAFESFRGAFRSFPAAYSTDPDGKPLLSWRVRVLPFLDDEAANALYSEFHLEEPWDSEHNKTLIPKMPKVFRVSGRDLPEGMTTYRAIGGPDGSIIKPTRNGVSSFMSGVEVGQIPDGTAFTALVVEGGDDMAVEWTRPEEYAPDVKSLRDGVAGRDSFWLLFCDGTCRAIPASVEDETLARLLTRSDGKPVDLNTLKPSAVAPPDEPSDKAPAER